MYGSEHYQVSDMASTSSTYPYYPNYHNHSHLHHHHMHHTPTAEILTGFSPQTHASNQTAATINSSTNHPSSMYHEYGLISSDPNFFESDSSNVIQSYYQNQTSVSDHGISTASQHTTSSSASSSNNDILPESVASTHIISSDNGLSYTNLDYMYGTGPTNPIYLHQTDDKSAIPHVYNQVQSSANIDNSNVHSQTHSTVWQSQHPNQSHTHHSNHQHHPSGYLENSLSAHQIGLNPIACLQNQPSLNALGANSNGSHNRNLNNRGSGGSDSQAATQSNSQIQSQQPHQPTYKWMQVKRNVQKPQGNLSFHILPNQKFKHLG